MELTKFYTVDEVAELLRVKPLTIYRNIKVGNFKPARIGSKYLFSDEDIKQFLDNSRMHTELK